MAKWRMNTTLFFVLKGRKLASKALKNAAKAAFDKEISILQRFSLYTESCKRDSKLVLFDRPYYFEDGLYECEVYSNPLPYQEARAKESAELVSKLDFNKLYLDEEGSLCHPPIAGACDLHWDNLICDECGQLHDHCECCSECGYYECECELCDDCGKPLNECMCEKEPEEEEDDLPSVNEGDGPMFA